MDPTFEKSLNRAGIDVADGILRMSESEPLYTKLLIKFLSDKNYSRFFDSLDGGDEAQALIYIHALKGLAANLSMRSLNAECVKVEAELKKGQTPDTGLLRNNYEKVSSAINDTLVPLGAK